MNDSRLKAVLKNMANMGLQQMLITDPNSIFYLTGQWILPGERLLALYLNISGHHKIFVNSLFTVQDNFGIPLIRFADSDNSIRLIDEAINHDEGLGIDKNLAAHFLISLMDRKAAKSYVCCSDAIDSARACKDFAEIEKMKAVSQINDRAMHLFTALIQPNMTEIELASGMLSIYLSLGAEGFSFDPLVGFGANAAKSHHAPDSTKLQEGDCVLIDVGCKKDGYCSDMTRTFFYHNVSKSACGVYSVVQKAIQAAEQIIRPGITFSSIDHAAREIIETAGYGNCFTHRLGHFIGIEVHDAGDVSSANQSIVQPGMIFSIEPGIYLQDKMGVRIEDLVLVTETGCEILNSFTKELVVL